MKKRFELSLDHPALAGVKIDFEDCLKKMVTKAIGIGSMEGTVALKIHVEILEATSEETAEVQMMPVIKYKVSWSVPIKDGTEGKIPGGGQLVRSPDGEWCLINNQISMEDLLEEDNKETD